MPDRCLLTTIANIPGATATEDWEDKTLGTEPNSMAEYNLVFSDQGGTVDEAIEVVTLPVGAGGGQGLKIQINNKVNIYEKVAAPASGVVTSQFTIRDTNHIGYSFSNFGFAVRCYDGYDYGWIMVCVDGGGTKINFGYVNEGLWWGSSYNHDLWARYPWMTNPTADGFRTLTVKVEIDYTGHTIKLKCWDNTETEPVAWEYTYNAFTAEGVNFITGSNIAMAANGRTTTSLGDQCWTVVDEISWGVGATAPSVGEITVEASNINSGFDKVFRPSTFGGEDDIWSLDVTPAFLNDPTFSIEYDYQPDSAAAETLLVDGLTVEVFYAIPVADNDGSGVSPVTPSPYSSGCVGAGPSGAPRVMVVGAGGVIVVSDDLGVTWTAKESGSAGTIRAVAYGDGKYTAVGDNGLILVSSDYGESWERDRESQVSDNLNCCHFDHRTQGTLMAGRNREIRKRFRSGVSLICQELNPTSLRPEM